MRAAANRHPAGPDGPAEVFGVRQTSPGGPPLINPALKCGVNERTPYPPKLIDAEQGSSVSRAGSFDIMICAPFNR